MSPTLLSTRLADLEDAGLVEKRRLPTRKGYTYHVTDATIGLTGIIDDLAVWGQNWARDMTLDDLDPAFLAWSMHLRMDRESMPPGRLVMEFRFSGGVNGTESFWLVNEDAGMDMCLKHPGYETDILVLSDTKTFVETWRGFRNVHDEMKAKRILVEGPTSLCREFPNWLLMSALAPHERKRQGAERKLYEKLLGNSGENPVSDK